MRLSLVLRQCAFIAAFIGSPLVTANTSVNISLSPVDWKQAFKPIHHGGDAPQLIANEAELLKAIKPLLGQRNYLVAFNALQQRWPDNPSAALLYIRAQIATQLKKYQQAEDDYQASMTSFGPYLLACQSLAGVQLALNKEKEARDSLVKAISLGGQNASLYGQLAYLNLRNHSAFSAVDAYQRAYTLEPDNKNWQQGLLISLSSSGSAKQASALINELLKANVNDQQLWLHKANAELRSGDEEMALTALEVAIRLGESNVDNIQLASQLHLKSGNIRRAVDLIIRHPATARNYNNMQTPLRWLSSNKRWQQQQRLLSHFIKYQNDFTAKQRSHLYTERARLEAHRGNTKKQQRHLKNALNLNPSNGNALMQLAQIHIDAQRLSHADLLLTRAQALDEYFETALLKRSKIAYLQQHYRQAHTLLGQVLQRNPARRDVVENLQILEQLIHDQA